VVELIHHAVGARLYRSILRPVVAEALVEFEDGRQSALRGCVAGKQARENVGVLKSFIEMYTPSNDGGDGDAPRWPVRPLRLGGVS
jgi:hypothetical protein